MQSYESLKQASYLLCMTLCYKLTKLIIRKGWISKLLSYNIRIYRVLYGYLSKPYSMVFCKCQSVYLQLTLRLWVCTVTCIDTAHSLLTVAEWDSALELKWFLLAAVAETYNSMMYKNINLVTWKWAFLRLAIDETSVGVAFNMIAFLFHVWNF